MNVVSESLSGWLLGALGALAVVGASGLAIYAQRRDHAEDRLQEAEKDITHIEGHLEATTEYRPRFK
jgi:hypothetical protein